MDKSNSYKKSFISLVVFLLLIVSSFSNIVYSKSSFSTIAYSNLTFEEDGVEKDGDDGFWSINNFEEDVNVKLVNCNTSFGTVKLDSTIGGNKSYDFSNHTKKPEYKAYYLDKLPFRNSITWKFFSIDFLTFFGGAEEYNKIGYTRIEKPNDKMFPFEPAGVHLFRFKIDPNIEISQLDPYWVGNAENDLEVAMYCWRSISNGFGYWKKVATNSSEGNIELKPPNRLNFSDISLTNKTEYVDICIVLNPKFGAEGTLQTDYVNVTAYCKGYPPTGTATSLDPIEPKKISNSNFFSWERFTWDDRTSTGITGIKYQILYDGGGNEYEPFKDTVLPGNEHGFYTSPVNLMPLNSHNIDKIKIKAELTTSDPSISPKIFRWGVTWQKMENKWEDLFNSSLRVDMSESSNITVVDKNVSIRAYDNFWTMFGQNPRNTRSSEGYGPGESEPDLYWLSFADKYGGGYRNPVIKDNHNDNYCYLYIASLDGKKIYAFDSKAGTGQDEIEHIYNVSIDFVVESSPALAETDEKKDRVIVATGETSWGGRIENKIYAFDKNLDIVADPFEYSDIDSDHPYICYHASPVIYESSRGHDDDKIFISSWSGDKSIFSSIRDLSNLTKGNNKIICLDLDLNVQWPPMDLPAGSFSSPGICEERNIVIVGCENKHGDSLFAFDIDSGDPWMNVDVGPIGRASPVIYDDKVFVVVKEPVFFKEFGESFSTTKVVALSLSDFSMLWNVTISEKILGTNYLPSEYEFTACSTPTVHDDVLFVISPDSKLHALDIENGNHINKWSTNPINLYDGIIRPLTPLVSSPAYADGLIYVGTENYFRAIYESNGVEAWKIDTSPSMSSSPIVVDGLLYYIDDNQHLYCFGSEQYPEDRLLHGSLVSIPISLPNPPSNYSWVKFNVNFEKSLGGEIDFSILDKDKNLLMPVINDTIISSIEKDTICLRADFTAKNRSSIASLKDWSVEFKEGPPSIRPEFNQSSFNVTNIPPIICSIQVQDKRTGLSNTSAEYDLKYTDQDGSSIPKQRFKAQCTGVNNSTSVENISANISELFLNENISENITDTNIRFYIINTRGNESYSEWIEFDIVDITKPIFFENNFSSTDMPPIICNILVQDNRTGLLNTSAKYRLNYTDQDGISDETEWFKAQYTGANNSTSVETISANVSERNLSKDIIDTKISFSIENTAGNKSYSRWIEFNYTDKIEPVFFENTFSVTDEPPIICSIKVQDIRSGLSNISAEYMLNYTDEEGKVKKTEWYPAQCTGANNSTSVETISANVSERNLSSNITHLQIRFSIKDIAGNKNISAWYNIGEHDYTEPVFNEDSFTPKWTNINTPICKIEVQDKDSDNVISGLNVNSAKYNLLYEENNSINKETGWISADCSGRNGSTSIETISVDISKLDFSENITKLISIKFYIEDIAGNGKYSDKHTFNTDTVKPSSEITNTADFLDSYNTTPVVINATAEDILSGIDHVALHYRTLPSGNWAFFESDDTPPYSWSFSVASEEYELCTIATDNASNEEDFPAEGDVSFIFDPIKPDVPSFDSDRVYKFDKLPEFSIVFKDDYKLKSVEYRLSLNEANEWTKINDEDIMEKSYEGNWNLTDDWEYMIENETYYMFFRLTDSLENQYITLDIDEAMMIEKNYSIPKSPYDPDLSDFEDWHWDNVFTVSVNATDEDITHLQLHYSYSVDNITWNEWKQYGGNQTESPFIWNFTAESGSGYYRFKTIVWDTNGRTNQSHIKFVSVTLFPTIPIIIMVPLAVILILVTALALGFKPFKLKKKKT